MPRSVLLFGSQSGSWERCHPNHKKGAETRVGLAGLDGIVSFAALGAVRLPVSLARIDPALRPEVAIQPLNFHPLYFATDCGRLYGVHHFPEKGQANGQAILIAPPMGQDYVRSHKTLQKLATDLAGIGYHVLRFDYAGTGDSSDLDDCDLNAWKRNALDALRELSERSETHRLSIVGVRLGASLAVSLDTSLDSLVLWDPVTSGSDYLDELNVLNAELLETTLHSLRANSRSNQATDELVGHKCTEAMQESLRDFSLEASLNVRPGRTLVIESSDARSSETPLPILDELSDSECRRHRLDMSCHWRSRTELTKTLMGQPAIGVILKFFGDRNLYEGRRV